MAGKKLVCIHAGNLSLKETMNALCSGLVVRRDDNCFFKLSEGGSCFLEREGGKWVAVDCHDYYLSAIDFCTGIFEESQAEWYENIPAGGVLCRRSNNHGYALVVGSQKMGNGEIWAVIEGGSYYFSIDEVTPVTNEWLEKMKQPE